MGLCASTNGVENANSDQKALNEKVHRELMHSRLADLYQFKCLVLGEGESGKSTVVKHSKLLYQHFKLDRDEACIIKDALLANVLDCVISVARASRSLNLPFPEEFHDFVHTICDETLDKSQMGQPMYENICKFIKCPHFKTVMEHRSEFWLLDNADYYLKNFERFYSPDFFPTDDDFLIARSKTTGIVETSFEVDNPAPQHDYDKHVKFLVVDVGGQRSERKKWMHIFDNVRAVLYVVNLAGYSMVLYEEESKNRMTEALELFEESANRYFKDLNVFLILNKRDLFEKSLEKIPLSKCFPDYTGGNDVKESADFVASKFQAALPAGSPALRVLVVSAHSAQDVSEMFKNVSSSLIEINSNKLHAEEELVLKELGDA